MCLDRMKADWDRLPVKKPWSYKDAQLLHALCGVFLYLVDSLKSQLPEQDYQSSEGRLCDQFESGFLDAELQFLLESCAPPIQLNTVQFLRTEIHTTIQNAMFAFLFFYVFCKIKKNHPKQEAPGSKMCSHSTRPVVLSVEQRQQRELELRDRELQAKVAQATCDHLVTQIDQDLLTLQSRLPTKEKEAAESLLDAKYLRDRQKLLGVFTRVHTSKFCFDKCHVIC